MLLILKNDRINSYFRSVLHDVTPQSASGDVTVLYAPVSDNPEISRLCATVLSEKELTRANRFSVSAKPLFSNNAGRFADSAEPPHSVHPNLCRKLNTMKHKKGGHILKNRQISGLVSPPAGSDSWERGR